MAEKTAKTEKTPAKRGRKPVAPLLRKTSVSLPQIVVQMLHDAVAENAIPGFTATPIPDGFTFGKDGRLHANRPADNAPVAAWREYADNVQREAATNDTYTADNLRVAQLRRALAAADIRQA